MLLELCFSYLNLIHSRLNIKQSQRAPLHFLFFLLMYKISNPFYEALGLFRRNSTNLLAQKAQTANISNEGKATIWSWFRTSKKYFLKPKSYKALYKKLIGAAMCSSCYATRTSTLTMLFKIQDASLSWGTLCKFPNS